LIAGKSPRIEDVLVEVDERERPALLRSLVALELTYRRRRGEHPTPQEYAGRFPSHETSIRDAFDEVPDTARDLLLGALALRLGLATGGDLVDAFASWIDDKSEPLDRMLAAKGGFGDEGRALLVELVRGHLKLHGDDPRRSLRAVSLPGPVRAALEGLGEPELRSALAHCGLRDGEGAAATRPRFRVVRRIDGGGLGDVYQAYDEELDREVALKQIRDRYASCPEHQAQLRLEAKVTGGLEHPGIVPAYASGQLDDGRPYYVMRLIRGRKFRHLIDEYHQGRRQGDRARERDPAMRKLLGYFISVCRTVAYAHHRGVLHLDLKPDNVMVREKYGETLVVDWGLTRLRDGGPEGSATAPIRPAPTDGDAPRAEGSATAPIRLGPDDGDARRREGRWGGTLRYMGPEQEAGEPDRSSDTFGLGAVLYQILTGQPPYPSARDVEGGELGLRELVRRCGYPPPHCVNPRVHPELDAICLKAMAPRPADRYADPGALADDVERWLADQPLSCRRDPPLTWLSRWIRHHTPIVIGLVSIMVLVAISSLLVSLWLAARTQAAVNFGLARDAVFDLMDRVIDARLSQVPQAERLRTDLATLIVREADKIHEKRPGDPDVVRDVAKVHRMAANLYRLGRDFDLSSEHYGKARGILEDLRVRYPNRIDITFALGATLTDEGEALRAIGQDPAALQKQLAARKLQDLLARAHGGDERVLFLDGLVHVNLGAVQQSMAQYGEAQQSFGRAVAQLGRLHEQAEQAWHLLALGLIGNGVCLGEDRQHAEKAETSFAQAIQLLAPRESDPKAGRDARYLLALAYNERGRLRAKAQLTRREAADDFAKARERLVRLCQDFPGEVDYLSELAAAHDGSGGLGVTAKRYEDAEKDLRKARDILEDLPTTFRVPPGSEAPYRRQYAQTLVNLARLAQDRGQILEARELLDKAIVVQRGVLKMQRENQKDQDLLKSYQDMLNQLTAGEQTRPRAGSNSRR
jgi:serine/threonine protein kinase/tetratricopeptide (TPR) repeat protein